MNYYEHHLGDFARDAGHLSMIKEGAYRRLIDIYYARQRPLPAELGALLELSKAKSRHERAAVESVLREFFELKEDGWHQKRCDEEIAKFKGKSAKAAKAANVRWHSDGNANAMRPHRPSNAFPDSNLQSPISSNHISTPLPLASEGLRGFEDGHFGSPKQSATNPRALGTNPRALGTNPRANGQHKPKERWIPPKSIEEREAERAEQDRREREEAARADH